MKESGDDRELMLMFMKEEEQLRKEKEQLRELQLLERELQQRLQPLPGMYLNNNN